MARKGSVTPLLESDNGRLGDREPGQDDATDFDPAKLEQPATPAADAGPDPFNPDALRLTQDFSVAAGVKKAMLTVPVRKPGRAEFTRVHPDPRYRLSTAVL